MAAEDACCLASFAALTPTAVIADNTLAEKEVDKINAEEKDVLDYHDKFTAVQVACLASFAAVTAVVLADARWPEPYCENRMLGIACRLASFAEITRSTAEPGHAHQTLLSARATTATEASHKALPTAITHAEHLIDLFKKAKAMNPAEKGVFDSLSKAMNPAEKGVLDWLSTADPRRPEAEAEYHPIWDLGFEHSAAR